jgi:very-short-patch-repair endonuclease
MRLEHVHKLAGRHFGLITRNDLRTCGLSDKQVEHLVRTRAILRVHRAVFRLAGAAPSIEQNALSACLAIGSHAVTSHTTAARLWRILDGTGDRPEVTLPRNRRSELSTVVVHRPRELRRDEVTRVGVIPVTRVARTVADLASSLSADDLEEALDEALRRRLVTPDQLARYAPLRRLAEDRRDGTPASRLERLATKALRNAGLPKPVRQHAVRTRGRTYQIDLAYPVEHVAIELEGDAPHWGRVRRQYDYDRRNALELLGWRVFAYTWEDTTDRTLHFVTRVGEALGLRPTRWRSAAR